MPIDDGEILELLRYLQERTREAGLITFDEGVVSNMRREALSPARMLLLYLDALDSELALRSRQTPRQVVDRLNTFVLAQKLPVVEEVELRLGPTDARLVNGEAVDLLGDLPDLSPQRDELQQLKRMVIEELERGIGE